MSPTQDASASRVIESSAGSSHALSQLDNLSPVPSVTHRRAWTEASQATDVSRGTQDSLDDDQKEKEADLRQRIAEASMRTHPLPARTRAHVSDDNPRSPWSRKFILTLDGGGIRGLSSLYILKRLIGLIEEIESGIRPRSSKSQIPKYWKPHSSSDQSPWIDHDRELEEPAEKIDEQTEDLPSSIRRCLGKTPDEAFKICHYFDYVGGTSTGGLSAILLGRPEMSIEQAINQYDVIGDQVFGKPRFLHANWDFTNYVQPKYKSKLTEMAFQGVIKKGTTKEITQTEYKAQTVPFKSDHNRCRTIVVAYKKAGGTRHVKHAHLFRTYDHHPPSIWTRESQGKKHLNPGPAHSVPIWQVARATSAAPKYFSPISFNDRTFIDGGIVANNPAKVVLNEVGQMHNHLPEMLVSIGTGTPPEEAKPNRKVSVVESWIDMLSLVIELATQSEITADEVEETCSNINPKVKYYRWTVPKDIGSMKLDEWSPCVGGANTKAKIFEATADYLSDKEVHARMLDCARKLVQGRRDRANTERWESFARRMVYYCPEPACHCRKVSKTFFTRDELREHGVNEHGHIVNVNIQNDTRLCHACLFDRCRHDGIFVFESKQDFEMHLRSYHGVAKPSFLGLRERESWLDIGRKTQMSVLEIREKAKKAKAAQKAQDKKGKQPVANGSTEADRSAGPNQVGRSSTEFSGLDGLAASSLITRPSALSVEPRTRFSRSLPFRWSR